MNNTKYSLNPIPTFAANPIIGQCQDPGLKIGERNQSQVLPGSERLDRNESQRYRPNHGS